MEDVATVNIINRGEIQSIQNPVIWFALCGYGWTLGGQKAERSK